jgi:hypothetical protein
MMFGRFWACISNGAKVNRLEGSARQLLRLGGDLLIIGSKQPGPIDWSLTHTRLLRV